MAVALVGCDEAERVLKDPRDGRVYKTTTIGAQTWMAENLNYEIADSYCYNNDTSNCKKYGRLYTKDAALKACPAGWHLPSMDEFKALIETVGAGFWGSTENANKELCEMNLVDADNAPYFNYRGRGFGNSVRCVKD